jgi:hypothetical protein
LISVQCEPRTDVLGYFHAVPSGLAMGAGHALRISPKGLIRLTNMDDTFLQLRDSMN